MGYKNQIGDGKMPNKYWVSEDNGYYVLEGNNFQNIEEIDKNFISEGKTYPKAFKTYQEALEFSNSLDNTRITIEDRLSGQIYESVKVITCIYCGKKDWRTFEDISFSKNKMEEKGYIFE